MTAAAKPESTAPATLLGDQKPAGTTGDQKPAGDGKPADQTPASVVVPEKYDLKLPDESPFDAKFVESFSSKAKEARLTQEQAKSVFDYAHQTVAERLAALQTSEQKGGDAYTARVKEWARQASEDKEIGGTQFQANLGLARRVAATFFEPAVVEWLENSGMGSHPGVVRALVKIGKAMAEDKLIQPGGGDAKPKEKSAAQVLYPSHYDEGGKPK